MTSETGKEAWSLSSALKYADACLARFVALLDARALDLDFRIVEKRSYILVLATSLFFATSVAALLANNTETPSLSESKVLAQAVVDGYELYLINGQTPGTFSGREIQRSYTILRDDFVAVNMTIDQNYLLRYHAWLGWSLIEAFIYLTMATVLAIFIYMTVVMVRVTDKRFPHRYPLNLLYYIQAAAFVGSAFGFVYGIVQLTRFARWRHIFIFPTPEAQYKRMRLQDFFDPFVDHGNLRELGFLVGGTVSLIFVHVSLNAHYLWHDRKKKRTVASMFIGTTYMHQA
ncbi:Hypothetical Protein FCC1311_030692 [Hondaea fermentalgiana]|uniref:Uncharacterized protein n=1 Tax=Hondaea fermentalgiana TaxID=2315210 RepID=A0A2R5G717_9STRA|nr:Hypothetical Protein FCC1311_030692 [Hondaea fermentalgiana]|eukprot:GBG26847.1 Hypothetical Protein FCC1311_030692 [Hondaea fermentalgiana]